MTTAPMPKPDLPTLNDRPDARLSECVLVIANCTAIGAGPLSDAASWFAGSPDVTEVVRMPVQAAGRLLFQPWPGRVSALALIAEAEHGR